MESGRVVRMLMLTQLKMDSSRVVMLTQLNFKAIGFDKEEEHNHINDEAVWLHALLRVRGKKFFCSLLGFYFFSFLLFSPFFVCIFLRPLQR